MSDTILGLKAVLFAAVAACAITLGGCESFTDYCTELNDCRDGNDLDLDACIVGKEHESEMASEFGCSSEFSTYQDCLAEKAECNNNSYGLEGNDCEDESREYSKCRY